MENAGAPNVYGRVGHVYILGVRTAAHCAYQLCS